MGVQLNLAEKMRASTGPWQELAKLFVDDFPTVYSLMKDRARSKDFQLTLSCFSQIVECMHPTAANGVPILKTNRTHLPKLLSNKGAVDDGLKSHLASVWNTLKDLIEADPDTFTNDNKYLKGVQTFAPVEMVAVAVLISLHSETRNNRLLLGDIQAMRIAVRENFADLRLNAPVWRWVWEYIDDLEGIRGAIDGSTVNRRSKQRMKKNTAAPTDNAAAGSTAAAITAAAAAPKRGRATARTKRPAATVAEETPALIKKEPETSSLPGPPSPKRRRIFESPVDGLSIANEQSWSPTPDAAVPPVSFPQYPQYHGAFLPPMPTRASTRDPQPAARQPRPRTDRTSFMSSSAASAAVESVQSQAPFFTPSEARQQRVTVLNNFQSAYRNSSRFPPKGVLTQHGQGVQQPRAPTTDMLATAGLSSYRNNPDLGSHTGLEGSTTHSAPQRSAPPKVRFGQKSQASPSAATQQADEGPIDLTSDTEQERQHLLSAFKTKPAVTEAPEQVSRSTTTTAPIVKQPRTSSQDLPTRENNPYAKFRNK